MNSKKVIKVFLTCILICTLFSTVWAQNVDPQWQIALTGSPLSTPQPSSFGFYALSDSKALSSVTESGILLRQLFLSRTASPFFAVLPSDHVCLVYNDGKTITLFNPDGICKWETVLPFEITDNPIWCNNGVILVYGKNQVAGISWNGSILWNLSFDESCTATPFVTDTGLYAFSCSKENSTVIRMISPFGIEVYSLNLAPSLTSFTTYGNMLYAQSSNGTVYCYQLNGKDAKLLWKAEGYSLSEQCCLIPGQGKIMIINGHGSLITLRNSDGKELQHESLWDTQLTGMSVVGRGNYTVISGNTVSRTMCFVISNSGSTVWIKNFDTKAPVFLTNTGLLCQYQDDWTITAWKTPVSIVIPLSQGSQNCRNTWGTEAVPEVTESFMEVLDVIADRALSVSAVSAQEQYGQLGNLMQYYLEAITASAASGYDCSSWYSRIISNETNSALLKYTMSAAAKAPFDSSRQVLNAVDLRLKYNRSGIFDDSLCFEACNTVYQICLFMGTPAIINQGQKILTQLLQPQYGTKVQSEAIETIQKLIELQKEIQK